MSITTYRQGDILFKLVGKLPENVKRKNDNIVAEGEVTGHKHEVIGGNLLEGAAGMFVDAPIGMYTDIIHDEHAVIHLPPGIYQVIRQREESGPALPPKFVRD